MVFKRRTPRGWVQTIVEFFYPRGGWRRAAQYVVHRVRRLPDEPHRIGRGVFAGVFVSFTPFFGLHFLAAAGIAWAIRGNILAALLATFFGNPLTTPIIAWTSVEFGHWLLGIDRPLHFEDILRAFSDATTEISRNFVAIFTDGVPHWRALEGFFDTIFLPYLVGGIAPGIVVAAICHYLSLPLVAAYKKRRHKKLRDRAEKLRALAAARLRDGADRPEA
ncbi:MAG: hypothetical protein RLZZ528_67 [Pseudomonadota bacterium]